jgi:hypothetical protein
MADTAVTAQTVIDNSIARAKDSYETQWSDAALLVELQRGLDYVHRILINLGSPLAMSSGTITMVAATQEYDLSGNLDDFWRMVHKGVYFSTGDPLTPITQEDAHRAGTTATDDAPTAFYLSGTKLGVVPVPSATSVASYGTLNCRYFAKPTTLTLSTNMPYKNLFNEPISAFASSLAMFKTDTPQAEYLSVYNALEAATIEIVRNRQ